MWNITPNFALQFISFCSPQRFTGEGGGGGSQPLCTDVNDCAKYQAVEHQALPTLGSRSVLANSFNEDTAYKLVKEHTVLRFP